MAARSALSLAAAEAVGLFRARSLTGTRVGEVRSATDPWAKENPVIAPAVLRLTSAAGQAALVADVYQQWFVGAAPIFAQYASVLYQNANDPGNAQVQAILKSLFGSAA